MKKIETRDDIDALFAPLKALAIIYAWNDLGLFDALRVGPQLLSELEADSRARAVTAPVLIHLGLLVSEGDRVALSPVGRALLERGDLPSSQRQESLRDLAKMTEILRDGGPVKDDAGRSKGTDLGIYRDSQEKTEAFLDMLYRFSEDSARETVDALRPLLTRDGAHILDVGGGHGRFARTFAEAGVRATLFDLPQVIDYARRKHGNAIDYRAGDFKREFAFGGPYDLVLFSNIIHGESPATNRKLIAAAAKAVHDGGYVVLKDMFLNRATSGPENAVFFGVTMLLYTSEGTSPRLDEAIAWLTEANLHHRQTLAFDAFQLIVAQTR